VKIAITSLYLPGGSKIGVGYQVHALANALTARGHQVTVLSACPPGDGATYAAVLVESKHRRLRTFSFAYDLRKVDFSKFDVLNAHGDDWFLWGVDRPRHVHTYHGSCLAEAIHATTWAGRARMAALAVCETQSVLLADDTVAVSENTRRYVPGIRHVIPCGVDTTAFHPGEKSTAPSVLFVGTMHGRKRGKMLLDLFRSTVRPKVPNVELWCVCDKPEGETDGDGVRWLGRVPHEELTALFRSAWVFCLPSTYEGFGVPYVEAMASGTAVVASPNAGSIEVTEGGRSGRIVGDADLAGTLTDLLLDRTKREWLAERGLGRSRDFGWETICRQYEDVYTSRS
jgi:phosphatidylinositol alpha-mannosyltransferase